jgi:GNAT superfamily N-acetyltransferase
VGRHSPGRVHGPGAVCEVSSRKEAHVPNTPRRGSRDEEVDIIAADMREQGRGEEALDGVRSRRGTVRDAPRIAVLCQQLGYPGSLVEIQRRLSQIVGEEQHALYVAEAAGGKVLGWIHGYVCHLVEVEHHVEIGGLVVDEDYRGSGIGRLLVEEVEHWAAARGCSTMRLRSNVVRKEAHRFYVKLGYEIVKRQLAFRKVLP